MKMKINVLPVQNWFENEYVSVTINDECNHAGAVETVGDYQIAIDDTKEMPLLECKCGAYQWGYITEDEDGLTTDWNGEWLYG